MCYRNEFPICYHFKVNRKIYKALFFIKIVILKNILKKDGKNQK